MKFQLIDAIIEQTPPDAPNARIVAIKQVSLAEEYLADHFPAFPILPGVLMIEAMVQAARALLAAANPANARLVLGEVKALKFGNMVRPGESLRVEVELIKSNEDGSHACRGTGTVIRSHSASGSSNDTAVSGKFTMRPLRVESRSPSA